MSNSTDGISLGKPETKDEKKDEEENEEEKYEVLMTLPPSHILQDGRFVHLPEPTDRERVRFFERSIARHGLLEDDLKGKKTEEEKKEEEEEEERKKKEEPQIHPLALASARLQSDGINELNRAINLQSLASNGEYFGLSNIVDPSLELVAAAASTEAKPGDAADKPVETASAAAAPTPAEKLETERELLEEQRLKASYILKRKRVQFENAGRQILRRHRRRLAAAIVAQSLPDKRLKELRPFWQLGAPEHGTRALPHAARPTEVVAADVDVYRKGEGVALGRLASRVPRYATMELQEDYKVDEDLKKWEQKHKNYEIGDKDKEGEEDDDDDDEDGKETGSDAMEVEKEKEEETKAEKEEEKSDDQPKVTEKDDAKVWTRAEPFAIADPALGKIDADFDPNKVTMLTLQFDIEKPSTGFVQSASLEPMVTELVQETDGNSNKAASSHHKEDEKLLVALQHSLFCAKLFESIRRELAPDTEDIGQIRTTARQSVVWLSAETEENFLPPPSLMSGDRKSGLAPLCVVHVHEGDAKVLLDCEYSLRIRLTEAKETPTTTTTGKSTNDGNGISTDDGPSSGSQSPAQLLALCHALLLHAQETYHRHSVKMEAKLRKKEEEEKKEFANLTPHQLQQRQQAKINQMKKRENIESPRILASCVSLGTKMLFERRIRKTLKEVNDWLKKSPKNENKDGLVIDWLSLSIFDLSAHFTISFRYWAIDANIVCDELTVTQFTGDERQTYRKAKFSADRQFEIFLKLALRKVLNNQIPK